MSGIPQLKKKLKSVRTTSKMSKAMKAVSAAKFARISALRRTYSRYSGEFRSLCVSPVPAKGQDDIKTETAIVFGSNLGFCGGFNLDTCQYFDIYIRKHGRPAHLIVCGKYMIRLLTDRGMKPDHTFVFNDIPAYNECGELFTLLEKTAGTRRAYPVSVIRPMYRNSLIQLPGREILTVNPDMSGMSSDNTLFFPDRETVLSSLPQKAFRALLFNAVLDTALGAQAATLTNMRSSYDNAVKYIDELEKQIHRQRQNEVTSDVIEVSSERGVKGDEMNA